MTDTELPHNAHRAVAWNADGPVTAADVAGRDKSTVAQPDPADIGPTSKAAAEVADAPAPTDFDITTATVGAITTHIRAADDPDESRARAADVWAYEVVRDGGIRSGVEDEVSRWLTDEQVASILADSDPGPDGGGPAAD